MTTNNEFKGSPAPWKARNERTESVIYEYAGTQSEVVIIDIQTDPANMVVTQLRKNKMFAVEVRANAQLIAASPDLLKELQNLVSNWHKGDIGLLDIENAEAAIKRALGGTEA